MFLYEKLAELQEKLETLENEFMLIEEGSDNEETIACQLNVIEKYIEKIEMALE